jgi:hypothetical protein
MIVGVALVLAATATVYTQSALAIIPIGSGGGATSGLGVIDGDGGSGGAGCVRDVCLSCLVVGSNGGQTAHDISALRAGIAAAIHEQFVNTLGAAGVNGGGPHTTTGGNGGAGGAPTMP